ncbi:MAG: ribosomal protein S18-alanine N-acetyltransferase [Thermostichales cyanobacterium SZTDM-1c_bins_54]
MDWQPQPLGSQHLEAMLALDQLALGGYWSRESYAAECARANKQMWGVFSGEELVGFAILWLILEEAHVVMLAVHPDYRRRGIGTTLVKHLLQIATEHHCRWAILEVRISNQAARCLYENLGFVPLGIRKNYYHHPPEDGLTLWKQLSP